MFSRKLPKPRRGAWFVPVRGSYLPATWQGWLTYVPYLYYLYISYVTVGSYSRSLFDTIILTIPFWVSAAVVMQWIARRKS